MSNFKKGDKVKLRQGVQCVNLCQSKIYTVTKSFANAIKLLGKDYGFASSMFELHEPPTLILNTESYDPDSKLTVVKYKDDLNIFIEQNVGYPYGNQEILK